MQSLVSKQGYNFPRPYGIRRGDVFDLATPELSKDAQVYCAKDVEVPLLAYAEYRKLPSLALQMKPEEVKVGNCVEICDKQDIICQRHRPWSCFKDKWCYSK